MLALVLAFSFSVIAEGASKADYKELILGEYDEESDSTPETIAEAVEIAGRIVDDEDEEIDYEKFKNLIVTAKNDYTVEDSDRSIYDISYADSLETLTINGGGKKFTTYDDGVRHFEISGSGPVVTFQRITFDNNDGGGVLVTEGTVSFDSVTFSGIDVTGLDDDSSERNGAALRIAGGEVRINNATFTSNKADNGGAIHISNGTVNFAGSNTFSANEAETDGGAIQVTGGTVNFSGTNDFKDTNKAGGSGGGVSITGGTVNFTTNIFRVNEAVEYGGAVDINGNANVTFTGVTFGDNSTNTAENGGAVSVRAGTATFNGSVFKGNYATNGGAMYISDGRDVTLNGSGSNMFERNSAENGGAVYLADDTNAVLNIAGSGSLNFKDNHAVSAGGAIYLSKASSLNFTQTVNFEGNYTENGNGGALYVYSPSQLPASTINFRNNRANRSSGSTSTTEGNGGAIYIYGQENQTLTIDNSTAYTFDNNTADYSGGAIYTVSSDVTLTGVEISLKNTATNGYGGFIKTDGTVTIEDATVSNQQGAYGGAIFGGIINAKDSTFNANKSTSSGGAIYAYGPVDIDNSEFTSNSSSAQRMNQGGGAIFISGDQVISITNSTFTDNTHQNNGNSGNGGGAVYAKGTLMLSGDIFRRNLANGNDDAGGAVFVNSSQATLRNILFDDNRAQGNGGGLYLSSECIADLSEVTFVNNKSTGKDGGGVYAQGRTTIDLSYFTNNSAAGSGTEGGGGAVYFHQSGNYSNPGVFNIKSSMLVSNTASNGCGGALYVNADTSTIDSCTFSNNNSATLSNSRGGGVYFYIGDSGTIQNSTFTGNEVSGGTTSYGGALATYGNVSLTMSTFTASNKAGQRGGGIYVGTGTLIISATIVVGNTAVLGNDVWSDASISSRGYNRIGTYGKGSANTSWTSDVDGSTDTDRSNSGWTTETFFGNGELGTNAQSETIPPYIGSILAERERILTLMLSEDIHLALADRATNVIPNNRKMNYPEFDQRGVSRWASVNDLTIGAVMFDGDNPQPDPDDPSTNYTISTVMMSGIPNTLRGIGQTASLTALIRYTNGRTAYGVPYDASTVSTGEERVRWTSSSNNTVKIDKNGNITALATTPNNSYVNITVSTVRNAASGNPATDSRPVRVTGQYSNMNISTEWQNYFTNYVQEITEEDISLMLVDASTATVRSSSFQRSFKNVWDVTTATQITDLTSSTPSFTTQKSYKASDGLVNSKNAAVNINFQNRADGDIFPLTYTWNFSGEEIKAILGYDLSGTSSLNSTAAENLFKALRIDFVGSSNIWQVIGGSGVKAKDAYSNDALTLTKADAGRGVRIDLTAYLANVKASGNNDGPQLVKGSGSKSLLIIPDGSSDGAISGTMWMVQSSSSKTGGNGDGQGDGNGNQNPGGNNNNSSSGGGGSGGGGCEAFSLGLLGLALIFMKRK